MICDPLYKKTDNLQHRNEKIVTNITKTMYNCTTLFEAKVVHRRFLANTYGSLTLLKLETKFYFQFKAAFRKIKYIVWTLGNFSQPHFCRLFKVGALFSLLPLEARAAILIKCTDCQSILCAFKEASRCRSSYTY